jgi:hypothetical protein
MAAKRTRKGAASRLVRGFFFLTERVARFFGLRGARPMVEDNPPLPFRASQPPATNWNSSLDPTPWMPQIQRNAALLASTGPVEPPWRTDPNALHAEIIKLSEVIEQAITELRKHQHGGMGHNNPPFSEQELDEISGDLAVLRKQSPATAPSAETTAAVTRLRKFGAYLLKLGDVYLTEFVKEAGKKSVQAPLWLIIYYELPKLADLAQQWLHLLPRP